MKKVDLSKVICISLKSHNESQLNAIGYTYNISLQDLMDLKIKGVNKIWIHINGGIVIAGLDTTNEKDIYFSPEYCPMTSKLTKQILSIKPVKTPKIKKPQNTQTKIENTKVEKLTENTTKKTNVEELSVDSILDKISANGIKSLTERELSFLKSIK